MEVLTEIWDVLSRNRLRTFLTALSVAWGMFMLALLLGAGRGLENGVAWEFRDEATNSIWVSSGKTSVPFKGRGPGRQIYFKNGDFDALGRELPAIEHRSGRFYMFGEFFVSYGAKHASFDLRGVHPDHRYIEKTEMVRGRFLNDEDQRLRRKVAVIGVRVRESLFGKENAIGRYIQIRGSSYLVVGEFEDVGGEAELRKIYLPMSTVQLLYNQPDTQHQLMLTLKTDDLEASKRTATEVRELLAERHGVSPDDRRAIRVQNNLEQFRKMMDVFSWIRVFVWIVGVGTLLAGIVGVSNILLISVAERTKEIGIRKALGATPASVVSLIVLEAGLITGISGYAGLVVGVFSIDLVASKLHDLPFFRQPSVDLRLAGIATLVLLAASVLAGLFPALRAARISPMIALRSGS